MRFRFLDFDQTFLDSKTKAEEALKTVDDIDEMVRIAYSKVQDATAAMQVKYHLRSRLKQKFYQHFIGLIKQS